jgi:hypothetical protein
MSNRNLKYQNGLLKRDAVRAVRAWMREAGALEPLPAAEVVARHAGKAHYIVDTNLLFTILEYWADELRHGLRELLLAQPALRLYLLDVVASECRGAREQRQRLYDQVVFNGRNAELAIVHPLRNHPAPPAAGTAVGRQGCPYRRRRSGARHDRRHRQRFGLPVHRRPLPGAATARARGRGLTRQGRRATATRIGRALRSPRDPAGLIRRANRAGSLG